VSNKFAGTRHIKPDGLASVPTRMQLMWMYLENGIMSVKNEIDVKSRKGSVKPEARVRPFLKLSKAVEINMEACFKIRPNEAC
jgi:hypothetical protein